LALSLPNRAFVTSLDLLLLLLLLLLVLLFLAHYTYIIHSIMTHKFHIGY
jgi:hypothetical protein